MLDHKAPLGVYCKYYVAFTQHHRPLVSMALSFWKYQQRVQRKREQKTTLLTDSIE